MTRLQFAAFAAFAPRTLCGCALVVSPSAPIHGDLTPAAYATSSPSPGATLAPPSASPWGPFGVTGLQGKPEPDPLLTPGVADPAVTQSNVASTMG